MDINDLKRIYGVFDDQDLAPLFKVSKAAVSKWKKNGVPAKVVLAAEQKKRADSTTSRLSDGAHLGIDGYVTVQAGDDSISIPEEAFKLPPSKKRIPIISWAQAGVDGFFEDSYPVGIGFGEIDCPADLTDPNAYALIINGDSMSPKYEPGNIVMVSPSAGVVTGNCAIIKLKDGQVMAKRIKHRNSEFIFESLNSLYDDLSVKKEDIQFMHRIVGVRERG